MTLADELRGGVQGILDQAWSIRDGRVVPDTDDVALAGGGVELESVFLYSDLADSTELARNFDKRVGAKVMKSFLYCASKICRARGGTITSFDGDRVMAVYVGSAKNTSAAKAALQINYAVTQIIRPRVEAKYPVLAKGGFRVRHATGVDSGKVLAVRAGMRGSNDLIWIGRAPGIAAKLSDIREINYTSFITGDVYNMLHESALQGGNPKRDMWEKRHSGLLGLPVYRSSWWMKP